MSASAIDHLLDALRPWADQKADVIHLSALSPDRDDRTIGDMLRDALAERDAKPAAAPAS